MTDALPENQLERAICLQNELISLATGGRPDTAAYSLLRREFMDDPTLRDLLPDFVRTCRDLSHFWGYIKSKFPSYAERRDFLWESFGPLFDHLEGKHRAPLDSVANEVLSSFDSEGVHAAWQKALARRHSDPEGAITAARTLLETVCKRILEDAGQAYGDGAELPVLYHEAAKVLNLAPSQHTEEVFRKILGNCQQVVTNLGSIRNKVVDAHGRGGRPVRPAPRHAALCVNLAGSVAAFWVETLLERKARKQD